MDNNKELQHMVLYTEDIMYMGGVCTQPGLDKWNFTNANKLREFSIRCIHATSVTKKSLLLPY